ncbi:MAG TPA: LETM1-related biofilm-associated protein [Flavobacterium sp.]|jgi:hypothetical protein
MINPSAHGWIEKYFSRQEPIDVPDIADSESYYFHIRKSGFIYGHIIGVDTFPIVKTDGWMGDEISKLALLNTLFRLYVSVTHLNDSKKFIRSAIAFYDEMNPKGFNLFKKVLPDNSAAYNLEKILDDRVQTNDNFIGKNFSHIVTNALLFIDVLAFQKYLAHGSIPDKYLKKTEEIIISVVSLALKVKTNKSKHDALLVKMFEASVRYSKFSTVGVNNPEALGLGYLSSDLEKFYLIDLAGMALWSDGVIEKEEAYFLHQLAKIMDVADHFVTDSITTTHEFISKHKKEIRYFNYSNPVRHFYDHMTESVAVLITRNKNRLAREIRQSGELMVLLAQSARRDLDAKEKKKVKKQLLEICKTIPSLTIFLLPGGSLLLPVLIKFIPQMLPSAFNENASDNE